MRVSDERLRWLAARPATLYIAEALAMIDGVPEAAAELLRARAILSAADPLFGKMREVVAGWHRYPDMPRHAAELGSTWQTTCGVVYAITDALAAYDKEQT
jgi:hypothetical protein